jgi:predicted Zn-dependent peptidase
VPARATLVVVGAFEAAEVRAWAARYFGAVRARPPRQPRASHPTVGRLARSCRLTIGGAGLVNESVWLAWMAPPRDSDDAAVLDVVAALLAGPRNARLTRRLAKVAASVALERDDRELAATFEIVAVTRSQVSTQGVLALIDEQLAALAAGRFGRSELSAARAYVARREDRTPGSLERAFELAGVHGQRDRERDREVHARVDHARVRAFMAEWLDPRRRVVNIVDHERVRDDVTCEEGSVDP